MQLIDLTGQILGPWEVLHRIEGPSREIYWTVRCRACGFTDKKRSYALKHGKYGKCKMCDVAKDVHRARGKT